MRGRARRERELALALEWRDATWTVARPGLDRLAPATPPRSSCRSGSAPGAAALRGHGRRRAARWRSYHAPRDGGRRDGGREAVAAGFGSVTRADLGGVRAWLRPRSRRAAVAGRARPAARQTRRADLRAGLVPFALRCGTGPERARREQGADGLAAPAPRPRCPAERRLDAPPAASRPPPGRGGDVARGKVARSNARVHARVPPAARPPLARRRASRRPHRPRRDGDPGVPARSRWLAPSAVIVPDPNPVAAPGPREGGGRRGGLSPADERFTLVRRRDAEGKKVLEDAGLRGAPPNRTSRRSSPYLRTLGAAAPGAGSPR